MSSLFGIGGNSASTGFYPFDIGQSLRFNAADSAYLEKTFSGTGNRRTFTVSFWFKRCRDGTAEYLFAGGNDTSNRFHMDINASGTFQIEAKSGGSTQIKMEGGAVLRDVSAWYHFVLRVDTTQATDSNRVRLYVNGDLLTFSSNTYPSQDADLNWNLNDQVRIGRAGWTTSYYDGYMCEFINVDGSSLAPTNFGETKQGIWIAKDYAGSYGTNGFRLSFQDSSALGDDTSGNGHDFTANNLATTDQMPDSPTDNRATFNALVKDLKQATALSDGNKTITFSAGTDGFSGTPLTIFRNEGKAYCEVNLDTTYSGNSTDSQCVFVVDDGADFSAIGSGSQNSRLVGSYCSGGSGDAAAEIASNGVDQGGSPSKYRSTNDRVGVYIDYDAGKGFFALNGTVQTVNGTPDIANGTNPHFTFTANSRLTVGVGGIHGNSSQPILTLKDDPSDWGTTPPDGYTSFSTANLQDPDVDPNKGDDPADYFNTVLYTGDGSSNRGITGVGFSPDFLWIKDRVAANNHVLVDKVRGVDKLLFSNSTVAEVAGATQIASLDSDGFTLGTSTTYVNENGSSNTYVAWNWKAGGSTQTTDASGDITSLTSVSTEAGFSIAAFNSGSTDNQTISHGLGKIPKWIIARPRDNSGSWLVYHADQAANPSLGHLQLEGANAFNDDDRIWNDTMPTSSVFTVGNVTYNFGDNKECIAYLWSEIEGFSRFGGFSGNGDADGQFVYTGFRPAWIMIKRTDNSSGANWAMFDNKRDVSNVVDHTLIANDTLVEDTSTVRLDMLSNGFKARQNGTTINTDNGTYVYMAFAEQPFKYANAR